MIKILYATDFSDSANHALDYVVELAKDLDAQIDLIHVYKVPPLHSEADFTSLEDNLDRIKEKSQIKLQDIASTYPDNIIAGTKAIFGMFIPQEIISYAEENDIDLIAMGAKGEHNVLEQILGSVTTHTMLSSPVPVLSVPSEAKYKKINLIAYATDLNPKSFLPISILNKIANRLNAELRIVHVQTSGEENSSQDSFVLKGFSNFPVDIIVHPSVEEGLNEYIKSKNVDWLSMFIPRRKIWERIFHPSLTKKMFFHSHIPLLVYKE